MKKFTHITMMVASALSLVACSANVFSESEVVETSMVEILTPTCQTLLTTDDLADLGFDTSLDKVLWNGVYCDVVHSNYEDILVESKQPVKYHYIPETKELFIYSSLLIIQDRFETYDCENCVIQEPRFDFVTKVTYNYVKIDCKFTKDGQEYHMLAEYPVFNEELQDGEMLYSLKDPNGQLEMWRIDPTTGNDIATEFLYSPSDALTYTIEQSWLDPGFDYGD